MRTTLTVAAFLIGLTSCQRCNPPTPAIAVDASMGSVSVKNATDKATVVYFAFGADSVVLPSTWSFCTATSSLNCSLHLKAGESRVLPTSGNYLNVTVSFDVPVGCGTTKAELNLNNPNWYDTVDVSLVDGYSNDILVDYNGQRFVVLGKDGNEKALGVFPYGCDICVARQSPPCGIAPGGKGCKAGTQYKPDVPCQYQGTKGGATVSVVLVKPEPAAK